MKVLVIPGWYPGKYTPQNGNFYVEQVKYLKQAGVDIAVITADLDYRYYLHLDGFFRKKTFTIEDDIPTFRINGGAWPKINQFLLDRWTRQMIRLFDDYVKEFGQPDVIHAHNFWGGYVAMQLAKKEGISYVFTEVFSGILSGEWPSWQKRIYLNICQNSSAITAVSQGLADVIEQQFFYKECHVIPNFIDTDLFALKKRIEHKKFRLLGIGGLIQLKRFDLQLEAFAVLLKKGYNIELLIIGSGTEKRKLDGMIKRLELKNYVSIVPVVEYNQVALEMQKADIFLLTSSTETFGIVVVEAMSVGTPVIATKTAGPSDILTPEMGILIPRNDADALAKAIEQMIVNYDSYKPKEIRAYAVKKYSKKVVTSQIIELYQKVIDSGISNKASRK